MEIYHGSPVRVERPVFGVGNPFNDYGLGFYCTESFELACEWACPRMNDGFANVYELDDEELVALDLSAEPFGLMHWLAVLLENRQFDVTTAVMRQAKAFVTERYAVPLEGVDLVRGYRADDSYFSFAKAFLDNRITLRQLERAMKLGDLGRQVVLKSERAFEAIAFREAIEASAETWHAKRMGRDERARRSFQEITAEEDIRPDDVFVMDLMRKAG